MSENKFVTDKVKALGSDITDTVNDLMREAKPLLNHASNRITDHVSDLTHQGLDAANKGKHAIEKKSHDLMDQASHMIRNEPSKAVLIAASIGAAVVFVVGMMSRNDSGNNTKSH
jgi:ElaB/YqjD/DUF883 family membrane-anchored ribosome-binding protein